jgi:hypothetical protein
VELPVMLQNSYIKFFFSPKGAPQGGLETRNRGSEVFDGNLRKPETRTTPRNQKSPSSAPKARKILPFCETAIIRAEGAEKFGRFA